MTENLRLIEQHRLSTSSLITEECQSTITSSTTTTTIKESFEILVELKTETKPWKESKNIETARLLFEEQLQFLGKEK